jgi:uncharacterized membrane protein
MGTLGLGIDTGREQTPFRIGDALSDALGTMFQHFFTFVTISAVANLPLLYFYWQQALHKDEALLYALPESLSERLIGAVCQAIVVYAAFQHLRGRPVSIRESASRGLSRFFPVILTGFLVTLIVLIGLILLFIPGVIASMMFAVALPACVVERLGPVASLKRSRDLTDGHRGAIFGAYFGLGILNLIVAAIVAAFTRDPGSEMVYAFLLYLWITFFTCYLSVVATFVYSGLRVSKEGVDIDQIAAVFD